jgi:hypothetical protein
VGDRRGRVLAVAVLLAVLTGCEAGVAGEPQVSTPSGPPASTPSATPSLSVLDPTLEGQVVARWPALGRNPAGLYSWDGWRCGAHPGASCTIGFMHNGYGSGDVEIHIRQVPEGVTDGVTAVTVAGRDGVYRRIDPRMEWWFVDIEGRTILIFLEARPGASRADLAEAHDIIGSMLTQPWDNDLGFRLVFTLATNDWDSG